MKIIAYTSLLKKLQKLRTTNFRHKYEILKTYRFTNYQIEIVKSFRIKIMKCFKMKILKSTKF